MTTARFYHAGCAVCINAEQTLLHLLDPKVKVEVVHLGQVPARVAEAEAAGVKKKKKMDVADSRTLFHEVPFVPVLK